MIINFACHNIVIITASSEFATIKKTSGWPVAFDLTTLIMILLVTLLVVCIVVIIALVLCQRRRARTKTGIV